MKNCPSCGLTNQDDAARCDCGFSFAGGAAVVTTRSASRPRSAAYGFCVLVHALLWCAVAAAALYAGFSILLASPANAVQQSAMVSFAAPPIVLYILARAFDELAMRFVER